MLDVTVLDPQPSFLGKPVSIELQPVKSERISPSELFGGASGD